MCLSVCLFVHEDISGTTRAIFTNFSARVAYRRGSVVLRQGDEIPRGSGSFRGFLSYWQCMEQHSIWDPKTAELIEMPFGMMTRVSRVLDGVPDPPKRKEQFWGETYSGTL